MDYFIIILVCIMKVIKKGATSFDEECFIIVLCPIHMYISVNARTTQSVLKTCGGVRFVVPGH